MPGSQPPGTFTGGGAGPKVAGRVTADQGIPDLTLHHMPQVLLDKKVSKSFASLKPWVCTLPARNSLFLPLRWDWDLTATLGSGWVPQMALHPAPLQMLRPGMCAEQPGTEELGSERGAAPAVVGGVCALGVAK